MNALGDLWLAWRNYLRGFNNRRQLPGGVPQTEINILGAIVWHRAALAVSAFNAWYFGGQVNGIGKDLGNLLLAIANWLDKDADMQYKGAVYQSDLDLKNSTTPGAVYEQKMDTDLNEYEKAQRNLDSALGDLQDSASKLLGDLLGLRGADIKAP
jgi:hypothetical protein